MESCWNDGQGVEGPETPSKGLAGGKFRGTEGYSVGLTKPRISCCPALFAYEMSEVSNGVVEQANVVDVSDVLPAINEFKDRCAIIELVGGVALEGEPEHHALG